MSAGCASVGFFFFQAEDGIRDLTVTGVQTCALPISGHQPTCLCRHGRVGCTGRTRSGGRFHAGGSQRGHRTWGRGGSGERRVGEEGRSRWAPDHLKKKKTKWTGVDPTQVRRKYGEDL